jgi:hypothetical protein
MDMPDSRQITSVVTKQLTGFKNNANIRYIHVVLCLQALQQFFTAALQKIQADYYRELAINKL